MRGDGHAPGVVVSLDGEDVHVERVQLAAADVKLERLSTVGEVSRDEREADVLGGHKRVDLGDRLAHLDVRVRVRAVVPVRSHDKGSRSAGLVREDRAGLGRERDRAGCKQGHRLAVLFPSPCVPLCVSHSLRPECAHKARVHPSRSLTLAVSLRSRSLCLCASVVLLLRPLRLPLCTSLFSPSLSMPLSPCPSLSLSLPVSPSLSSLHAPLSTCFPISFALHSLLESLPLSLSLSLSLSLARPRLLCLSLSLSLSLRPCRRAARTHRGYPSPMWMSLSTTKA